MATSMPRTTDSFVSTRPKKLSTRASWSLAVLRRSSAVIWKLELCSQRERQFVGLNLGEPRLERAVSRWQYTDLAGYDEYVLEKQVTAADSEDQSPLDHLAGDPLPGPRLRKRCRLIARRMFPRLFPTLKKPVASTLFLGRESRNLYSKGCRAGNAGNYYTFTA